MRLSQDNANDSNTRFSSLVDWQGALKLSVPPNVAMKYKALFSQLSGSPVRLILPGAICLLLRTAF